MKRYWACKITFASDPRTINLSERLRVSRVAAVGILCNLFCAVRAFAPDGNLEELPEGCLKEWSGSKKLTFDVLAKTGWLQGRQLVDWSAIEYRAVVATRARREGVPAGLRFAILKRDGFACHYCGRSAPQVTLHVDHVIPVADGGETTVDNLAASCEECNLGKGRGSIAPDGEAACE